MPIAAASDALVTHLRSRLEQAGALEGWTVEARTSGNSAQAQQDNLVALVLWRVQPDEPSGESAPLRAASQGICRRAPG